MTLATKQYSDQVRQWPASGRHILALFDDETIIVCLHDGTVTAFDTDVVMSEFHF